MENNPFNIIENSREIVWMGDGLDGQVSRSYTCTFCKRGFSNAQALGGHMNIHRRDRARLKESSDDQTLISPDNTKKPDDDLSDTEDNNPVQQEESSSKDHEEKSSSLKRIWLFPDEDDCGSPKKKDAMGEVVQLPLFVEKPLTSNSIDGSSGTGEKMKVAKDHTSSSGLDLELRLGMD